MLYVWLSTCVIKLKPILPIGQVPKLQHKDKYLQSHENCSKSEKEHHFMQDVRFTSDQPPLSQLYHICLLGDTSSLEQLGELQNSTLESIIYTFRKRETASTAALGAYLSSFCGKQQCSSMTLQQRLVVCFNIKEKCIKYKFWGLCLQDWCKWIEWRWESMGTFGCQEPSLIVLWHLGWPHLRVWPLTYQSTLQ